MRRFTKRIVGLGLVLGTIVAAPLAVRTLARPMPFQGVAGGVRQCAFRLRVANTENMEMVVPKGEPVVVIAAMQVGGAAWVREEFVRVAVSVARWPGGERFAAEPEYIDYYTSDLDGFRVPAGTVSNDVDVITFNLPPGEYMAWATIHAERGQPSGHPYVAEAQADLGTVVGFQAFHITAE